MQADRRLARETVVRAWAWWLVLSMSPVVALLLGLVVLGWPAALGGEARGVGGVLTGLASFCLLLAPGALVLRSHCFRAAWGGRRVPAGRYVRGMLTVWSPLAAGAVLGVLGVLVSGSVLPAGLPLALSLAVLGMLMPSARAVE
jgi:hypothetical protein